MTFVHSILLTSLMLKIPGMTTVETGFVQTPSVSICELAKRPSRYASTMVVVDGVIDKARHGIWLTEQGCDEELLLTFPNEVNLTPPAPFTLEKDSLFDQFQTALYEFRPGTMELKNTIRATIVGRFDSAYVWKRGKRVQLALGYGEHNLAKRRLVIQRIAEIILTADKQ